MAKKINYPYGVKSIILENNGGGGAGGDVYLDGNSLVIPEQEQPQPVATIDNVAYYHKQEFDLETIYSNLDPSNQGQQIKLDLLTGESILGQDTIVGFINNVTQGSGHIGLAMACAASSTPGQVGGVYSIYIFKGTLYSSVDYTSRAFTVVDTQEEVTDNTKICLPTCSAYYGFLSEDGKTFISYYNLKSEGAPEYVDSIKQGNAVIPLKDTRVPDAEIADAGKVVKVGEDGNYELGEAGGSEIVEFGDDDTYWFQKTIAQLWEAVGSKNGTYIVKAHNQSSIDIIIVRIALNYGSYNVDIFKPTDMHYYSTFAGTNDATKTLQSLGKGLFAPTSDLDSSKTYVLKYSNDTVQWVEEVGQ